MVDRDESRKSSNDTLEIADPKDSVISAPLLTELTRVGPFGLSVYNPLQTGSS